MFRWSSMFLGMVVSIGLTAMLCLLGMALGLSFVPIERMEGTTAQWVGLGAGSAIYLFAVLAVCGAIGGFVTSRAYGSATREGALLQAVGLWGLMSTIEVVTLAAFLPLFGKGVGISVAGMEMAAFFDEFRKSNPRIVTDMSIMKGKVVSSLQMNSKSSTPTMVVNATKQAAERAVDDESVAAARKIAAGMSLFGFLGSLLTLVTSIGGALLARRRPATVKAVVPRTTLREGMVLHPQVRPLV